MLPKSNLALFFSLRDIFLVVLLLCFVTFGAFSTTTVTHASSAVSTACANASESAPCLDTSAITDATMASKATTFFNTFYPKLITRFKPYITGAIPTTVVLTLDTTLSAQQATGTIVVNGTTATMPLSAAFITKAGGFSNGLFAFALTLM